MRSRVYRSKVSPLFLVLVALALPAVYAYLWQAWEDGSPGEIAVASTIVGLLSVLVLGPVNTRYWIEGPVLHVRAFVFRWRIPVESIIRITAGAEHGTFRKAALSLDMIEIWHRRGSIAISPRHRRDFLADLNRAREALGLEPARGIRA